MLFRQRDSQNRIPEKRILVVDSDSAATEVMRNSFRDEGFEVIGCTDVEALYSMDLSEFNLVIVDLSVNDGNGLNIIDQIKHTDSSGATAIPVIACSVNNSPTKIISALSAGADDYMLKPYSLRELLARVRSVLRRS